MDIERWENNYINRKTMRIGNKCMERHGNWEDGKIAIAIYENTL